MQLNAFIHKLESMTRRNMGGFTKENFDGADSLVSCIGMIHKLHYGEFIPKIENIVINEETVEYDVCYWNKKEHRKTYLNVN